MTIKEVASALREGSAIAKMFNEIKDGKVHNLQVIRAKFIKAGVKKPIQLAWRLCRILRANRTGYMVELSKRSWTIQLVPFVAKGAVAKTKPVVKSATKKVVKPVAKKPVVKTKTAMHIVRASNKQEKATPVLAGGLEEE